MHPFNRLKALVVCLVLAFGISFSTYHYNNSNPQQVAEPQSSYYHNPATDKTCFLVISDIHLHSLLKQDDITPTGAADTGHDLWDSTQNYMKRLLAGHEGFVPPKFIVVLGDLPWHAKADIKTELESARDNSGQVLHDLRTLAENAHIPLIYVPGNNDSWDGDYHPFSTKIFEKDAACKTCWPVLPEASIIDVSRLSLGCYSAYPLGKKGKLRVIVLNTTIFSHKYTDREHQSQDATAQINWLTAQLEQAKTNSEYVLIAMHIPPGLDGYKKKDFWHKTMLSNGGYVQNAFLDLIDKYQDRIVGLLSSHTHMDGIRRLYNRSGKMIAVDISVPGITPGHGNNPGMKMISYNPANFELLNFITLYEPFYPGKKVVRWTTGYDFKDWFGCQGGATIRTCLDTLNIQTLQNADQVIYKVMNGRGDAGEVNSAIDVRYE